MTQDGGVPVYCMEGNVRIIPSMPGCLVVILECVFLEQKNQNPHPVFITVS